MLLITILSATLLIVILLYPTVKNLFLLIKLGKEKLKEIQKKKNKDSKQTDFSQSVVGKSKFDLRQPLPTATITIAKEPDISESVSNFASDENQEPMDIDVPLEKEIIEDNDIDEEQEAIELEELFGKDVCFASGVEINELGKLKHIIETPTAEIQEKRHAGKILYENKETDMVEQMVSKNSDTASIISNLIDLHMTSFLKEKGNENNNQVKESDDINDFDVTQFLNTK